MPAGFQSFNDSGTVQIDDNYSTMTLVDSPTISITTSTSGTPYRGAFYTTVTVTASNPLAFIGDCANINSLVTVFSRKNLGGNTWQYVFTSLNPGTVRVYFFGTAAMTSSNSGMQVFAADGRLIFDSSASFLRIRSIFQITGTYGLQTFAVPQDGRQYAAALSYSRTSIAGPILEGTHYWYYYQMESIRVSSSEIRSNAQHQLTKWPGNNGLANPPVENTPPQIILVDVSYM